MSSSTRGAQKPKKITIAYLQQRTKDLFSQEVMNASPFAKELYKLVRNKVKKLDDIQRIEERIKEVGAKNASLTEEQQEKMQNKESYMQSVQQTIEAFEIYKSTELASLM
jgi:aspartyl aminopeptidase